MSKSSTEAAAEILALINASPATPRLEEIQAILDSSGQDATDTITGPVVGSDGKPVRFDFTDKEFADRYCPWIRVAFMAIGYDEKQLQDFTLKLGDSDGEVLGDALSMWQEIGEKFSAIADFANAALARVILAGEAANV